MENRLSGYPAPICLSHVKHRRQHLPEHCLWDWVHVFIYICLIDFASFCVLSSLLLCLLQRIAHFQVLISGSVLRNQTKTGIVFRLIKLALFRQVQRPDCGGSANNWWAQDLKPHHSVLLSEIKTKSILIYKGRNLYLFTNTYYVLGILLGLRNEWHYPVYMHLESYGRINLKLLTWTFLKAVKRPFEIFPLNNSKAPWKSQWCDY